MQVEKKISRFSNKSSKKLNDPGKGEKLISNHSFKYEWLESIKKVLHFLGSFDPQWTFLFVSFSILK